MAGVHVSLHAGESIDIAITLARFRDAMRTEQFVYTNFRNHPFDGNSIGMGFMFDKYLMIKPGLFTP